MRAAIYHGQRNVTIEERLTPACGPKDVLLQTIYASVCGTDAAVYKHGPGTGHRITVGSEFGHEAVCRVAQTGTEVTDFQVGQRVYPYPLLVTGDTSRAGTMGAFSQYILAPEAKAGVGLYPTPDGIDDRTAALIEPFTVGTRAARRTQVQPGENAIVFGAGTIGIAAAIALKKFGWLPMVGSFAVGLLFFMMIPSLTPLNSGVTNVLICLIGGVLFSGVLGMVSGKVLNATSLV